MKIICSWQPHICCCSCIFSLAQRRRIEGRMDKYLVDVFGKTLASQTVKTDPIEENSPLPSRNHLKYRILIKNKKLHQNRHRIAVENRLLRRADWTVRSSSDEIYSIETISMFPIRWCHWNSPMDSISHREKLFNEVLHGSQTIEFDFQLTSNNNRNEILCEQDENSFDDDEQSPRDKWFQVQLQFEWTLNLQSVYHIRQIMMNRKQQEPCPILLIRKFLPSAHAEQHNRGYEIWPFSEDKAQSLVGNDAYTFSCLESATIKSNFSKWYSCRFHPYLFWPVACEMVAFNYQRLADQQKKCNYFFSTINKSMCSMFQCKSIDVFVFIEWYLSISRKGNIIMSMNRFISSKRSN